MQTSFAGKMLASHTKLKPVCCGDALQMPRWMLGVCASGYNVLQYSMAQSLSAPGLATLGKACLLAHLDLSSTCVEGANNMRIVKVEGAFWYPPSNMDKRRHQCPKRDAPHMHARTNLGLLGKSSLLPPFKILRPRLDCDSN